MNDSSQETDNNGEAEEDLEETTEGTPFEQQHIPPEGMLDRASLEAMTRSWWGADEEEGVIVEDDDDDDSTSTGSLEESFQMDALGYGNVQGFSHLDSTALEAVGAGGLLVEDEEETMDGPTSRVTLEQNEIPGSNLDGDALNSFLNDDDPRLHPPVASLPARDDDEKAAYRSRLPPRLLSLSQPTGENEGRTTSGAAPEQEDPEQEDPEREESYRLPGLSNNLQAEEPRPGAQAMEGRGPRPAWANASAWTRSSDAGVRQTLRESIIPFRLRRGSADLGGAEIPTVEASAVNPAETVVYATNVAPDQTARARKITVGLGILAILLIVGLSTGLTISLSRDDRIDESDLDLQCFIPPEDQDVFVRCNCFNTTEGLVWTEEEQAYYRDVQRLLVSSGVVEEPHSIESCTLQNQCMVWTANYKRRNTTDEEAQLALKYPETMTQAYILCFTYQSLDGPNWKQNDGWLVDRRPCEWFGVTCSFLSRATGLRLPRNGLKGSFPSELGRMAFLRELELSRNPGITGALPTEIGQASALHVLDLSHTSMNGTLPSELENLEILDRLVLSNNSFSGTIPDNMTIRMREMYLDHNVFTGTLHSELLALTNLEILNVANSSLVGSIPDIDDSNTTERRRAWRHLEHLDLSRNDVTGSLPEFLGSRKWLVTTFVYETLLSGPIPETYCKKGHPHARVIANCTENGGTGLIKNCSCCEDDLALCVEDLPPEVQDFI